MKNVVKYFLSVSLCLFCAMSNVAQAAEAVSGINLQQLEDLLKEHKGKVVVLNFFATWCPPCREEIPGLVEIAKERTDDVVIIGLSVDKSTAPLAKFMQQYDINYPVRRAEVDVQKLFEVQSIPHNAVFDKEGEIVANESGFVTKKQLNAFIDSL